MGVVFKELFTSPDSCSKNGTVLVGSPAVNHGITLNGATQYATNPKRLSLNGQGFIVVRFTPSFAYNENVLRYLFMFGPSAASVNNISLAKRDAGTDYRLICSLGTGYVFAAGTDYGPFWLANEENILVISLNGVSSAMWLNGNVIPTVKVAMPVSNPAGGIVGDSAALTTKFSGSIQSLIIGNRPLTQGCEERLIMPEPLSRIRTENSLVTIPGVQSYNRVSDGKRVTPLLGKIATQHGVREAVLGDGTTATTFPTLITPRGFSFDGGDYINLGDNDAFTFADDAGDKPFSLAVVARPTAPSASYIGKMTLAPVTGEWGLYSLSTGNLNFVLIDHNTGGYAYVYSPTGSIKANQIYVLVVTKSSAVASATSMKIYINGVSQVVVFSTLNYTRMRNTAVPVGVGTSSAFMNGNLILPEIYDVELSECEVRALTARMQRQARSR